MNTISDLVELYNPKRVIIWFGEDEIFNGTLDYLDRYTCKNTEWICHEYFEETGELIINV